MKKNDYCRLKENKGTVTIKVEEVLLPIFAQGKLCHQEQRLVWAIIADSWRWKNAPVTQRPLDLEYLAKMTKLSTSAAGRVLRNLIGRFVILVSYGIKDRRPYGTFNEHFDSWLPVPCRDLYHDWQNPAAERKCPVEKQPNNPTINDAGQLGEGQIVRADKSSVGADKSSVTTDKSSLSTPGNVNNHKQLRAPKNNFKNNFKNNKESPVASRRNFYEIKALEETIYERFGLHEKHSRIQLALKMCQEAELHPIDLINQATRNWFGYVRAACATPDKYRDRIRNYYTFADDLHPLDPKSESLIQESMPQMGRAPNHRENE